MMILFFSHSLAFDSDDMLKGRKLKDRTPYTLQVVLCTLKFIDAVRRLVHATDKNGVQSTACGAIYSSPGLQLVCKSYIIMLTI